MIEADVLKSLALSWEQTCQDRILVIVTESLHLQLILGDAGGLAFRNSFPALLDSGPLRCPGLLLGKLFGIGHTPSSPMQGAWPAKACGHDLLETDQRT